MYFFSSKSCCFRKIATTMWVFCLKNNCVDLFKSYYLIMLLFSSKELVCDEFGWLLLRVITVIINFIHFRKQGCRLIKNRIPKLVWKFKLFLRNEWSLEWARVCLDNMLEHVRWLLPEESGVLFEIIYHKYGKI
jgi:hypothetical protein